MIQPQTVHSRIQMTRSHELPRDYLSRLTDAFSDLSRIYVQSLQLGNNVFIGSFHVRKLMGHLPVCREVAKGFEFIQQRRLENGVEAGAPRELRKKVLGSALASQLVGECMPSGNWSPSTSPPLLPRYGGGHSGGKILTGKKSDRQ